MYNMVSQVIQHRIVMSISQERLFFVSRVTYGVPHVLAPVI